MPIMRQGSALAVLAMPLLLILALAGCPPHQFATLGEAAGGVTVIQRCSGAGGMVVLLVDPDLPYNVRAGLDQFETDLCSDGYSVLECLSGFSNPVEVRDYLAGVYAETGQQLVCAMLFGDVPYAYQWFQFVYTNPQIPPDVYEVISYQYYADLDGTFGTSPGYVSPGGHAYSYDVHSGAVDWELWIGVFPLYKESYSATADALLRYFERNHAYRTGQCTLPRAFLEITEHHSATTQQEHNQILGWLTNGQYAWTPFSSALNAEFYFDSTAVGMTAWQGYGRVSAGAADFTVTGTHGSGLIDTAWVESHAVNTVFFWSDGCAVANLDQPNNFLTAVLYSPTSQVLMAKGTTNNSGGMGTNSNGFFGHNIATSLSQGAAFGQAVLDHVNVPLIYPWSDGREFHYATPVFLGDPTLRLRP